MDELADKFVARLVDKLFGMAVQPVASPRLALPLAVGSRPQFRTGALNAMQGIHMQSTAAAHSMQPTVATSLWPVANFKPPQSQGIQGRDVSVQAMQDKLQSYGISPSPMQKVALT